MSDRSWYEHELKVKVEYSITTELLFDAVVISIGQMEKSEPTWAEQISTWSEERLLLDLNYHLCDYGSQLRPGWYPKEVDPTWMKTAQETLARFPQLIGRKMEVEVEICHFGMTCLLDKWMEIELSLHHMPGELVGITGRTEGARIVRIPDREFGFASGPDDRADFDQRLHTLTDGLDREGLDKIVHKMVSIGGPYWSGRTHYVKPIQAVSERLVQEFYPEIARCAALGYFYIKNGKDGRYDFCDNVCEAHRRGREDKIGTRPHFADQSDNEPLRCKFTRDIPILSAPTP